MRSASTISFACSEIAPGSLGSSWVCKLNYPSVKAPALKGAIYHLQREVLLVSNRPALFLTVVRGSCQSQVLIQMFFSQGHAADVFEAYTQLLTEMVLRLPYQIKKIADTNSRIPPPVFDHSWFYFLSEVSEGPSRGEDTAAVTAFVAPWHPNHHVVFPPSEPLPPFRACPSRVYYVVRLWKMRIRSSHPLYLPPHVVIMDKFHSLDSARKTESMLVK